MKKIWFLLLVFVMALGSCTMFDLQSRAKHAHLNKVPVNESVESNIAHFETMAEVIPSEDVSDNVVIPESKPAVEISKSKTPVVAVSNPMFHQVQKNASVRQLTSAFRAHVKSQKATSEQSIDPVTLLVWVLIIAVILALLGMLIPNLLEVFIGLLLVVLIVMAIMYLAGSM